MFDTLRFFLIVFVDRVVVLIVALNAVFFPHYSIML